jgi:hypothetical protein
MQIQRLCLFLARMSEAEPLELGSQAEPRNQLNVLPDFLVPRLCLGMQIQRLCLFLARISEAEPLELGSQAEPRN